MLMQQLFFLLLIPLFYVNFTMYLKISCVQWMNECKVGNVDRREEKMHVKISLAFILRINRYAAKF